MKQPLTREEFERGLAWGEYLDQMGRHQELVRGLYEDARLSSGHRRDFEEAIALQGGRIYLSALTEEWCGDSAANLPIIARLEAELPAVSFRVLVRHDHPTIRQAYEAEGIDRIPIVSLFDASFREIGRWIERPKVANAKVEAWIAGHPELEALMASESPADKQRRSELFDELLLEMADWYRERMWSDTLGELKQQLRSAGTRAAS